MSLLLYPCCLYADVNLLSSCVRYQMIPVKTVQTRRHCVRLWMKVCKWFVRWFARLLIFTKAILPIFTSEAMRCLSLANVLGMFTCNPALQPCNNGDVNRRQTMWSIYLPLGWNTRVNSYFSVPIICLCVEICSSSAGNYYHNQNNKYCVYKYCLYYYNYY